MKAILQSGIFGTADKLIQGFMYRGSIATGFSIEIQCVFIIYLLSFTHFYKTGIMCQNKSHYKAISNGCEVNSCLDALW
jgi:lysozyme family protein